jgi:transposase-like protein
MTGFRRKLDLALKVQVVLEAIRGKRTITELALEYGVHFNENYCLEEAYEEDKEALLRKIGQLEMERDWLQKN